MKYIIAMLILSLSSWNCESYKILAVFPISIHSHYEISSKLLNGLARSGHEVTVYSPHRQNPPVKNLKEISIASITKKIQERQTQFYDLEKLSPLDNIYFSFKLAYMVAEEVLKHEEIQKLFKTDEEYDLIILPQFMHESLMSIAHHFKKPTVLLATMPLYPWSNFIYSYPTPPSYVPVLYSEYTGHMNFWQRLTNTFYDAWAIWYQQFVMLPQFRELAKKYVPGQPDLYNYLSNVSLVLINSHMSTCEVIPHVPNAVEIGGFHVEAPKKLPEDLQKFLDDSTDGVVVFSLGSNVKSTQMPTDKRDAILKAFSKLKQNVLWKWETESLPGQPKNVKIMKWLPQSDVLAHANVKAFITHGGLLSIMEGINYGIPMIGIPFFGDQRLNMATVVYYGYGIQLSFQEINEEKLTWALNEILNNNKYRESAKSRSNIMRDRPMKPLEAAVYWIEYVVRHQGAFHLRHPGTELTWYQRNLIDVAAFVIAVMSTVIYIIIILSKKVLRRLSNKEKKE